MSNIGIKSFEEVELLKQLETRNDPEGLRLKRFLAMPDLSRTPGSPLYEMVERILALPDFKDFDIIDIPEVVPADVTFDLFDFPKDHPARSRSDTYYLANNYILRTHTTVMWYYYLRDESVKNRMAEGKPVGGFSFGKVYRKDEIDRQHMNVFHQIDAWYLVPKNQKILDKKDLEKVLSEIARAIFGENLTYKFKPDYFPYTDPSIEMEAEINGRQVELLGSGIVRGSVLEKFGVDSSKWNGWAFGFGLERLAIVGMDLPDIRLFWSQDERVKKQLHLGNKFKEVSKYPSITRDISFVVNKDFIPNDYFDLIRDLGGDLVEQVELIDKYEDSAKFGSDKISYIYRIVYRSMESTLKREEVDLIQDKIYKQTAEQFNAELR